LNFDIHSDYKDYFKSLGIKRCKDFIDIERKIAGENSKINLTEKRVHRTLRGKQFRRIDIITVESIDNNSNEKVFYLKRGSGQYAKVLKNEYKIYSY